MATDENIKDATLTIQFREETTISKVTINEEFDRAKKKIEVESCFLYNKVWPGVIHAIGASNICRLD